MSFDDAPRPALPLLVVDAANVVGSVPDGWWRDRRAATERLLDSVAPFAHTGVPGMPGPVDITVVVEGRARGAVGRPGIRIVEATGSGDDTIVDVVSENRDRQVAVVTADRELRSRVEALGAETIGPKVIREGA
ncbi:hypothetical protein [Gordonia sputi]|uniref:NTP pyrophosphohydrolase n=1 Tax=Gordonia sputi NBRC 100414 TaxID=1089453 RepID=H5U2J3_9ACTN|nr:hypothetical protein [Gordonia sputi]NKY95124.1 NYN domain-containing protein [Gordonia sputi]GAB39951.1 hypothetical protein GOSPT_085_00690 [Gordonia sputi NBRC 100414]